MMTNIQNRIKNGKVVESGSHDELIKKGSVNDEGKLYVLLEVVLF